MGYVKIVNDVVLLSLFSLTSGSRLSPWCHGQVTKPYRQVTIVQRFHGTLMLLGLQSFGFLSITLHWDHVFQRVRANFWTDELFLCATRLIATVQILLLKCLHESVRIFASVSIRRFFFFFFHQKRLALVKTSWDTRGNLARRRTLLNKSYSPSQKSLEMLS